MTSSLRPVIREMTEYGIPSDFIEAAFSRLALSAPMVSPSFLPLFLLLFPQSILSSGLFL